MAQNPSNGLEICAQDMYNKNEFKVIVHVQKLDQLSFTKQFFWNGFILIKQLLQIKSHGNTTYVNGLKQPSLVSCVQAPNCLNKAYVT